MSTKALDLALVAGYAAVLAVIAFWLPPDFILGRLHNDALNYYILALSSASHGAAELRIAANDARGIYASGAGYFYAPVMLAFQSFDARIHAIQFLNIFCLTAFYYLAVRYFRLALSSGAATFAAVGFLIFLLLDTQFTVTLLVPNSDVFPSLVIMVSFLIAADPQLSEMKKLAVISAIAVPGIFVKMSVAVLPVSFLIATGVASRSSEAPRDRISRYLLSAAAVMAVLTVVFVLNRTVAEFYFAALVTRFFPHGLTLVALALPALNAICVAIPGALIPNFHFVLAGVLAHIGRPEFISLITAGILFAAVMGASITAVTVYGGVWIWRSRRFDIIALLLSLIVFSVVISSTWRYLIPYQPLIWVCFLSGCAAVLERLSANQKLWMLAAGLLVVAVGSIAAEGRLMTIFSSKSLRDYAPSVLAQYVGDVTNVNGSARKYLMAQDEGTRLLLTYNARYSSAVWSAITPLRSYDSYGGWGWERGHRVLAVLSCRNVSCNEMDGWRAALQDQVHRECGYGLALEKSWHAPSASIEIYRLLHDKDCAPPAVTN